jgi:hypothetical protein
MNTVQIWCGGPLTEKKPWDYLYCPIAIEILIKTAYASTHAPNSGTGHKNLITNNSHKYTSMDPALDPDPDPDPHQTVTDPQHWLCVRYILNQSVRFVEGQAFSWSYDSAPRPPPSPLWGRRRARSRIIRPREFLALYKSYPLVQDVHITSVGDPWHFDADRHIIFSLKNLSAKILC